ncbi:hypothetical protein KP509_39G041600 [Ceratopteris richardii]|uniref:Uncharacterized protein n=1 Tax=Ceratopteris richardii TaxID=49495 RepID=A0A8T2Q0R5_CERRI|nr:hypothetical protein KP509_39G041600 [Ceratopteris richardii]
MHACGALLCRGSECVSEFHMNREVADGASPMSKCFKRKARTLVSLTQTERRKILPMDYSWGHEDNEYTIYHQTMPVRKSIVFSAETEDAHETTIFNSIVFCWHFLLKVLHAFDKR